MIVDYNGPFWNLILQCLCYLILSSHKHLIQMRLFTTAHYLTSEVLKIHNTMF